MYLLNFRKNLLKYEVYKTQKYQVFCLMLIAEYYAKMEWEKTGREKRRKLT